MKLYYATYILYGVQTITTASGSTLYVKAENKEEAKQKIFDYIRNHYSVQSIGYRVMETPDRYSFAIMTDWI